MKLKRFKNVPNIITIFQHDFLAWESEENSVFSSVVSSAF